MVTHCLHKKPKCTLKSSSDHPYEFTYLLSKHIPGMVVNQACAAAGNSEYSNTRTREHTKFTSTSPKNDCESIRINLTRGWMTTRFKAKTS